MKKTVLIICTIVATWHGVGSLHTFFSTGELVMAETARAQTLDDAWDDVVAFGNAVVDFVVGVVNTVDDFMTGGSSGGSSGGGGTTTPSPTDIANDIQTQANSGDVYVIKTYDDMTQADWDELNALSAEDQAAAWVHYSNVYHPDDDPIVQVGNTVIVNVPPCDNGNPGFNGTFTVIPPPTTAPTTGGGGGGCTSGCTPTPTYTYPDLRILDAYFLDTDGHPVDINNLGVGMTVTPIVRYYNNSNVPTDQVSPKLVYKEDSLYGLKGGFSVRERFADQSASSFGSSGELYRNNVPALKGYEGVNLIMDRITFTTTGDFKIQFYLDPADTCTGSEGCITEEGGQAGNSYVLPYTVHTPSVSLGSFYDGLDFSWYVFGAGFNCQVNNAYAINWSPARDVEVPPYPGECTGGAEHKGWSMMWSQVAMNPTTCVGSHVDSTGKKFNDFSGISDDLSGAVGAREASQTGADGIDYIITSPVSGQWADFTLSCKDYAGLTFSDTHRLYWNPPTTVPSVIVSSALNSSGNYATGDRTGSQRIQNTDQVQLKWESQNADSCQASIVSPAQTFGPTGANQTNVNITEPPPGSTYTYQVVCRNNASGNTATDSVKIETDDFSSVPVPTLSFYAQVNGDAWSTEDRIGAKGVDSTDTLNLRWATSNVKSCTAKSGDGFYGYPIPIISSQIGADNYLVPGPHDNLPQTYTIDCLGLDGTHVTDSIIVGPHLPVITIDKTLVSRGSPVQVTWDPRGFTGCTLSSNITDAANYGTQSPDQVGTVTAYPIAYTTYTIDCGGGAVDSKSVSVTAIYYED